MMIFLWVMLEAVYLPSLCIIWEKVQSLFPTQGKKIMVGNIVSEGQVMPTSYAMKLGLTRVLKDCSFSANECQKLRVET